MAAVLRLLGEAGSLAAVVLAWVIAAREYPTLPERFPIHFGITGQPDRWGTKRSVWLVPAISTALYLFDRVILDLVARDPRHPGTVPVVVWLHCELLVMFLFAEVRSIAVARGRATGLGIAFLPITLAVITGTALLLTRG